MEENPSSSGITDSAGTTFSKPSRRRLSDQSSSFGKVFLVWNWVAPFFMSAALFLSGFFAVFSPLPFLLLGVTRHWGWLLAAVATNASLVYFSSGPTVFQFYLLAIATLGLTIPFFLYRRLKPESIVVRSWVIQWCLVAILIGIYAIRHAVTPWQEIQRIFANFFDLFLANLKPESRDQLIAGFGGGGVGIEEWRKKTLSELPGALGILCLFLGWFNLRVLFNLNPNRVLQRLGLDRRVLNRWKNADWLIWPTLAAWAVVLFADGVVSDVALNFFKVLMAAYGIQGLAVIGSGFEAYRVGGFFRVLVYSLVMILMMPLLLSIGFFDQWFDFRSKFRQT